ncbi:MAG: hypothetical protein IJM88_04885 [Bacteroidales bacterium]|nr:hypothetical protein [Bacteroidales bacterium]
MEKSTVAKIYEWASYVLIVASTVFYFVWKQPMRLEITLLGIVLAMFCRSMLYRTRNQMYEAENEELKVDLRRLTNLLEVEKRKHAAGDGKKENQ